jgi:ubiquinol-cytochrome c reductase iron-sulfur subunit
MSTLLRTGIVEPFSRAAYGKAPRINPLKPQLGSKSLKQRSCEPLTNESMKVRQSNLFLSPRAVTGMNTGSSIRFYHTDVAFPNMDEYRKSSTKDPTKRNIDTEDSRKMMHYLSYGIGGMIGMYTAKAVVVNLVEYKSPPRDQLALAAIEINLADIPEGKSATFMWRGKPCFVRHRTQEQVDIERSVPMSELRDPQKDEDRVQKPEWLVVIGICTHLGCVPIAYKGDFNAYYCPCHGSHYDNSGRIRKGPAPNNLEVPEHEFTADGKLVIGKA